MSALDARAARGGAGFVLLAVVLLVGIVALIGATFVRHAALADRSSPAALSSLRASGALDSGLHYTRQWLRTGGAAASTALEGGDAGIAFELEDLGGGRSRASLSSLDAQGVGATLLLEIARLPRVAAASPDELPRLRAESVAALLANAAVPKTWISGMTVIADADLQGVYVIEEGGSLSLSRVALTGCIVSAKTLSALAYGPYAAMSAPTLMVAGGLRITPGSFLPGVALVMPDGVVSASGPDVGVQLEGDVVAHTILLPGGGALRGNLASVAPAGLGGALERPGRGRAPLPWAAVLDTGSAWDTEFVAVVPRRHTPAELPLIVDFAFDEP